MSPEDRTTLLALARRSVLAAVAGTRPPPLENPSPALAQPGAAFVTLRSGGDLRGCVGRVRPEGSVWECVLEMAQASALRDGRFSPLGPGERFEVEISLLSPLAPIRPQEIRIGVHGLCIRLGNRSGVLLPQVPIERNWNVETFLSQLCRKAELPSDAWTREGAFLYGFTAEHFSEA